MVELHFRPRRSYQDNGSSIHLHLTHIEPGHCISCRSSTGYGVGLKENTADQVVCALPHLPSLSQVHWPLVFREHPSPVHVGGYTFLHLQ